MYLQTKPNEEIKTLDFLRWRKGKLHDQNLSCWNRYLLMCPNKCTLKNLQKKYQKKWENAYLRVKNARASRALRWANIGLLHSPDSALLRWKISEKILGPPLPWPHPGSASPKFDTLICLSHYFEWKPPHLEMVLILALNKQFLENFL